MVGGLVTINWGESVGLRVMGLKEGFSVAIWGEPVGLRVLVMGLKEGFDVGSEVWILHG